MNFNRLFFLLALATNFSAWGCAPSHSQQSIAGPIEISTKPTVLSFKQPLQPKLPWTDILFELIAWPTRPSTPLDVAQEAGLEVSLIEADGKVMPMKLSWANQYVSASYPGMHWPTAPQPTFSALRISAKKPIRFSRVVWLGYDPKETKDGTYLPSGKDAG